MITARIQINYKTENNRLIQTIQILPQKKRHIKYFLNNKYQAGRILDRADGTRRGRNRHHPIRDSPASHTSRVQ